MPAAAEDFVQLREAYRQARSEIDKYPDPIERNVGLASLRLEATQTYKQLDTTAPGIRADDVDVLEKYVKNLVGGETAEKTVATLDAQALKGANSILSGLTSTLLTGVLVGAAATIVGVATNAVLTAEQLGAWIVAGLAGGGSVVYFAIRAGQAAGSAGQQAWIRSWGWANSLGQASDRALANARARQAALINAATGGAWTPELFTTKARIRAQLLVGASWVLVAIGVVLVGWGVFQALDAQTTQTTVP